MKNPKEVKKNKIIIVMKIIKMMIMIMEMKKLILHKKIIEKNSISGSELSTCSYTWNS